MTVCSKNSVITLKTKNKLNLINTKYLYTGKMVPKNNYYGNTFTAFFTVCTNTNTLTKSSFKEANMHSALSSMICSSLRGGTCRLFCRLNEPSSHMMPCMSYLPSC
jgi:hypothetical protein